MYKCLKENFFLFNKMQINSSVYYFSVFVRQIKPENLSFMCEKMGCLEIVTELSGKVEK